MSVQAITAAYRQPGLTSAEAFLLVTLANYADHKMICWPSQTVLARDTRLSRRRIITLLQSLEEKGILTRKERFANGRMTSALITLTMRGEEISPQGEAVSQEGCNPRPIRGEASSHKPTREPIKEPSCAREASAVQGQPRALVEPRPRRFPRPQAPTETPREMAARLRALAKPTA